MQKCRLAFGVDIGGTNISIGLVTSAGKLVSYKTAPSQAFQGGPAVIDRAKRIIKEMIARHPSLNVSRTSLIGIGVGCPGSIDYARGVSLARTENIPRWRNLQIGPRLEQALGFPVFVENDANAMALGEQCWGAGKGAGNMVCLTLGTGIGCGIIINGELYRGSNYYAGEFGHIKIGLNGPTCGCGSQGCLETFFSGRGIVEQTINAIKNTSADDKHQGDTILLKWTGGNFDKITAKMVFDAAGKRDYLAVHIIDQAIHYLGRAIASLINLIDPEIVVLSGRITRSGENLFRPIRRIVEANIISSPVRRYRIVPSRLGEKAGLFGAAALAFRSKGLLS